MTHTEILAAHNLKIVRDAENDRVSDRAVPRAEAEQIVSELRAIGATADWAQDHDDRSVAWIYFTPALPRARSNNEHNQGTNHETDPSTV